MPSATARGDSLAELVAPLRADPQSGAILCDIDGTLAPIVDDPASSRVPEGTREVLREVAARYGLVACVSGRRAREARRLVGIDEISYAGNHGFEVLLAGEEDPTLDSGVGGRADAPRRFVEDLDQASLAAAGLMVEDKGAIQALHWRRAPDRDAARDAARVLADLAARAGLVPRWGRLVLEIRPIAGIDKGSAVTRLVRDAGVRMALFGGDDETDLDAFNALRWLRSGGRLDLAVCIGVASDEEPEGLAEHTDVIVEGTGGFASVLHALARPAS